MRAWSAGSVIFGSDTHWTATLWVVGWWRWRERAMHRTKFGTRREKQLRKEQSAKFKSSSGEGRC